MSIYKILSIMKSESSRQEIISRNLSSINIPGYRHETLLTSSFKKEFDNASESKSMGKGVKILGHVDHEQGALKVTGRELDFSINGKGMFKVETDNLGTLYTRNGHFRVSPEGKLVTLEGHRVQGVSGDIEFGPTDLIHNLKVSEDGKVSLITGKKAKEVGQIQLYDIEKGIDRVTSNYFRNETSAKKLDITGFTIQNQSLEQANFSPIREMVTMIESLRQFEMGQKFLKIEKDAFQKEGQTFTA